nr:uncharacterized protein LOC113710060 [Coffea arabica]
MAITLRSDKQLEDRPMVENGENNENKRQGDELMDQEVNMGKGSKGKSKEEQPTSSTTIPIPPAVPFSQQLKPNKLDKEFEKFIPSYAKFLKEIMTRKRRLDDRETITLTEECSAIIQNKLPPKLKELGSFSIPCTIGNIEFLKVLCDLGASVSLIPLMVARQLRLHELKRTNITLQLADRSVRYPVRVLENVLIKVQKFIIPVDFVVLDMEENMSMPIISSRPFLAIVGTIIDVKNSNLKFQVGEKDVAFNLNEMEKYPFLTDHACSIDTIDVLTQGLDRINFDVDSLEICLSSARMLGEIEEEINALAQCLNAQPPYRKRCVYENLGQGKGLPPFSEIEAPKLELKPLPSHLKYEFLGENV